MNLGFDKKSLYHIQKDLIESACSAVRLVAILPSFTNVEPNLSLKSDDKEIIFDHDNCSGKYPSGDVEACK